MLINLDIDECSDGTDNCNRSTQSCENLSGSFTCLMIENECPPGFIQDPDVAEECVDINECKTGNHSCDLTTHDCINSDGSFSCAPKVRSRTLSESCRSGFRRNRLSNECEDVNECETLYRLCLSGQTCQNTIGSYVCNCQVYCQLVWKFFVPYHSFKICFSIISICNKIINRLVIPKIPWQVSAETLMSVE